MSLGQYEGGEQLETHAHGRTLGNCSHWLWPIHYHEIVREQDQEDVVINL